MEQTLKVCIYGATGYTASELIRALLEHPKVEIVSLISSSKAGSPLSEVFPHLAGTPIGDRVLEESPSENFDLAFLCLPHEASLEIAPRLLDARVRVIDLSGAFRIKDPQAYPEFYGFDHSRPDLLKETVYGLPELFRDQIRGASFVANPGCYPTATLLALYPFLKEGIVPDRVVVHALSGVSGAGRKPKQHFHFPEMEDNFFCYSVEKHRHTPEMEDVIRRISGKEVKVRFTPTVVPAPRGMISTVYVQARVPEVRDLFLETYRGERFIRVANSPPMTRWVLGTNLCFLYPFYDKRTSTVVVVSVIDNLGKGASLQAVQNMNLMAGFEEELGIPNVSIFP